MMHDMHGPTPPDAVAYAMVHVEPQIIENEAKGEPFSLIKAFFEKDFSKRRFHQKELFFRLPARPVVKFIVLYLLKRGFLDGRAGFTYSVLQSFYEYFIVLKVRELKQDTRGIR